MCRRNNNRFGRRGFTLIELLVVIAMTMIMTGMVITNLKKFAINFYISASSKKFLQSLSAAQAEAVNGDSNVIVYLDTGLDRYQFRRSVLVSDADENLVDGPYITFNPITGTDLTIADEGYWSYLDPQRNNEKAANRVSFGDMTISGGSKGGLSGSLICFAPRTGIVDFCQGAGGALRGSLILVPDKEYYEQRFGEAPNSNGQLKRGGASRKIIISRNGDFNECRWVPNNGEWNMPICN